MVEIPLPAGVGSARIENGELVLNARTNAGRERRTTAVSKDGGASWSQATFEISGAAWTADIDSLAKKYIGQDVYPWRAPGEQRISFLVDPTHVLSYGG